MGSCFFLFPVRIVQFTFLFKKKKNDKALFIGIHWMETQLVYPPSLPLSFH